MKLDYQIFNKIKILLLQLKISYQKFQEIIKGFHFLIKTVTIGKKRYFAAVKTAARTA
jgi:hypothetical protein